MEFSERYINSLLVDYKDIHEFKDMNSASFELAGVEIEGFRNSKKTRIDLKTVNVFTGSNNSGKSNLAKLLSILNPFFENVFTEHSFDTVFFNRLGLSYGSVINNLHLKKNNSFTIKFILNSYSDIDLRFNKVKDSGIEERIQQILDSYDADESLINVKVGLNHEYLQGIFGEDFKSKTIKHLNEWYHRDVLKYTRFFKKETPREKCDFELTFSFKTDTNDRLQNARLNRLSYEAIFKTIDDKITRRFSLINFSYEVENAQPFTIDTPKLEVKSFYQGLHGSNSIGANVIDIRELLIMLLQALPYSDLKRIHQNIQSKEAKNLLAKNILNDRTRRKRSRDSFLQEYWVLSFLMTKKTLFHDLNQDATKEDIVSYINGTGEFLGAIQLFETPKDDRFFALVSIVNKVLQSSWCIYDVIINICSNKFIESNSSSHDSSVPSGLIPPEFVIHREEEVGVFDIYTSTKEHQEFSLSKIFYWMKKKFEQGLSSGDLDWFMKMFKESLSKEGVLNEPEIQLFCEELLNNNSWFYKTERINQRVLRFVDKQLQSMFEKPIQSIYEEEINNEYKFLNFINGVLGDTLPTYFKALDKVLPRKVNLVGIDRGLSKRFISNDETDLVQRQYYEFTEKYLQFQNNTVSGTFKHEDKLGENETFEGRLNFWVRQFNLGDSIEVEKNEFGYNSVWLHQNGRRINVVDCGYGVNQIIPVLLAVISSDGWLIIEEPESNLHPSLQSKLADFIISESKAKRIFIETHSEYFLRRMQFLAKKDYLKGESKLHSKIKIQFFSAEKNEQKVEHIDILPNGDLSQEFPSGFVDEAWNIKKSFMNAMNKN